MKRFFYTFVVVASVILFSAATSVSANNSPLPFLPGKGGNQSESNDVGSFSSSLGQSINEYAPEISFLFTAIFTLMFVVGVIKLGYALVTKTGNVLKGSTGMLIFVPVFIIVVRLFFILFFTTYGPGVTLLVSDTLAMLITIGFFAAIGMILIGLLMRLFYKFLNHPEYGRWSKRLFQGAAIIIALTAIMPTVLQGI